MFFFILYFFYCYNICFCLSIDYSYSTGHYKIDEKSGSVAVPVNLNFVVISSCCVIFKEVVHSLEPGETPSSSASHQAPNYVQRS